MLEQIIVKIHAPGLVLSLYHTELQNVDTNIDQQASIPGNMGLWST